LVNCHPGKNDPAMARRKCSRCSFLLPDPDESREEGERIVCPQCAKVYAIRKEKKRKFECPSCHKKVVPPDEFDPEETFRCPWCQIVVRLTPRPPSPPALPSKKTAANKPARLLDSSITPASDQVNAPEVEVAFYGETILIDENAGRLPRYFWMVAGGLSLALVIGLIVLAVSQIKPSTARVRGTIYYGEKPVGSGVITFIPDLGQPISTTIRDDGSYLVDNLPYAEARITIAVYPVELQRLPEMSVKEKRDFFLSWGRRPVTVLPEKYVTPESTPLKYTIAQADCVHDIRIAEEAIPPTEKRQPISEDD